MSLLKNRLNTKAAKKHAMLFHFLTFVYLPALQQSQRGASVVSFVFEKAFLQKTQ